MKWTLRRRDANSTASLPPVMSVDGSCGSAALQVMVEAGESVTLDASGSYSPDADARLNFTWFQYCKPSSYQ
jgi:hypothetical protein